MDQTRQRVVIGIITFRRHEGLSRLLTSLQRLEFPRQPTPEITMIVVDNDVNGSAEAVCKAMARSGCTLEYTIEPRRGISFARNAILDVARGRCDFLAFIDDDEVAETLWLDELLLVQSKYDADVVSGPVLPVFIYPPRKWVEDGGFFQRPRHPTGSKLKDVASGNVLIRSEVLEASGVRFDTGFALTGGSDTLFFRQLSAMGATMVWADDATVHEWIPISRANAQWLIQRAYRGGNSYSRCEVALFGPGKVRPTRTIKGLARIGQGLLMAPFCLGRTKRLVRAAQNIALGAGAIAGAWGMPFDEYKETHST